MKFLQLSWAGSHHNLEPLLRLLISQEATALPSFQNLLKVDFYKISNTVICAIPTHLCQVFPSICNNTSPVWTLARNYCKQTRHLGDLRLGKCPSSRSRQNNLFWILASHRCTFHITNFKTIWRLIVCSHEILLNPLPPMKCDTLIGGRIGMLQRFHHKFQNLKHFANILLLWVTNHD